MRFHKSLMVFDTRLLCGRKFQSDRYISPPQNGSQFFWCNIFYFPKPGKIPGIRFVIDHERSSKIKNQAAGLCAGRPIISGQSSAKVPYFFHSLIIVHLNCQGFFLFFRRTGIRIKASSGKHAAYHAARNDLMSQLYCSGAGQQFMMCTDIFDLFRIFPFIDQ